MTASPRAAADVAAPGTAGQTCHLPLEGTYNVRDAGGHPTRDGRSVRWRTLYRADSLHRLTPQGQEYLIDAGLRTVIDLRRDVELAAAPNVLADSDRVAYHWISLAPNPTDGARREIGPDTLAQTYQTIVTERQTALREVLSTLARPGAFPALVHCTAGKDRTGIVVGLLLALAGVDHATIAEDYALTATFLGDGYFADARVRAEAAGHTWEQYRHLLGCPADLMRGLLDRLEGQHGSIAAYLGSIGLTSDELETLRAALLGDDAAHGAEHAASRSTPSSIGADHTARPAEDAAPEATTAEHAVGVRPASSAGR